MSVTIRLPRKATSMPAICACCLESTRDTLLISRTKSYPLGVASVHVTSSAQVPYCRSCVRHVLWYQDGGMPGSILRSVLILGLMGLVGAVATWFAMLVVLILLSGGDQRPVPVPVLLIVPTAGGVVLGAFMAYRDLKRRLALKVTGPLGPNHCKKTAAVTLLDLGQQHLILRVDNQQFGAAVLTSNALAQAGATAERQRAVSLKFMVYAITIIGVFALLAATGAFS